MCTQGDTLQQFEAAMALTNIASISIDAKDRIIALNGVRALENVQFADHYMCRRAGTEAIVNLVNTDEGFSIITGLGSVFSTAGCGIIVIARKKTQVLARTCESIHRGLRNSSCSCWRIRNGSVM